MKFPVNHLTLWKRQTDQMASGVCLAGILCGPEQWPGGKAEHMALRPLPSDPALHLSPPSWGPTPALSPREQALTPLRGW